MRAFGAPIDERTFQEAQGIDEEQRSAISPLAANLGLPSRPMFSARPRRRSTLGNTLLHLSNGSTVLAVSTVEARVLGVNVKSGGSTASSRP